MKILTITKFQYSAPSPGKDIDIDEIDDDGNDDIGNNDIEDDYQILGQPLEPRQGVADFQAVQGSSKGFLCCPP